MKYLHYFLGLLITTTILQGTPKVLLSTHTLNMGDTLRIDILSNTKLKKHTVGFINRPFQCFKYKSSRAKYHYVTYVAAPRKIKSGTYPLNVYYQSSNKKKGVQKFQISVKNMFKKGKVTLNRKKNRLSQNHNQLRKEGKLISTAFKKISKKKKFKTSFTPPTTGRITSKFGTQRKYNNTYSRSHAGVDIANKIGTPVKASNSGRVIFSKYLKIHGNTIIIDHGMGIVTIYNHLNERHVFKKRYVRKGQVIGTIGDTGVATGPHLHWGMSVQNVRVNPQFWLKNPHLYTN